MVKEILLEVEDMFEKKFKDHYAVNLLHGRKPEAKWYTIFQAMNLLSTDKYILRIFV